MCSHTQPKPGGFDNTNSGLAQLGEFWTTMPGALGLVVQGDSHGLQQAEA